MNQTAKSRELRALVESALLVALAFGLSYITVFRLPQGGSITPLSMLPILMIGLRHGLKWGLLGGIVYAGLQILQQVWAPPGGTIGAWVAMLTLDYILAFGVLGLSGLFKNSKDGILYAVPLCLGLRYLCHFISGVLIWGYFITGSMSLADNLAYAEVWSFSLAYNGTYMIPEIAFTMIAGVLLYKKAPILFNAAAKTEQSEAA